MKYFMYVDYVDEEKSHVEDLQASSIEEAEKNAQEIISKELFDEHGRRNRIRRVYINYGDLRDVSYYNSLKIENESDAKKELSDFRRRIVGTINYIVGADGELKEVCLESIIDSYNSGVYIP